MRNSKELSLKELMHEFVNHSGKQQLYADRIVMDKWPEYVGEICAKHSKCTSVKNGILKVQVPNASMRFELAGQKSLIIDRINADFSMPVIQDIFFF